MLRTVRVASYVARRARRCAAGLRAAIRSAVVVVSGNTAQAERTQQSAQEARAGKHGKMRNESKL